MWLLKCNISIIKPYFSLLIKKLFPYLIFNINIILVAFIMSCT
jgi:hypothetical protein